MTKYRDTWQTTKGILHLKHCSKIHSRIVAPYNHKSVARSIENESESNNAISISLIQQSEKAVCLDSCKLM